ncbi:MAG TPA: hypothetical protein VII58_10055 [Acidobacteriaceae bacterium]
MSDNALQTLQHVIQDVLAPDVRELKVRVSSIEKQMETQYNSLRDQMSSLHDQLEANFKAMMAAIGESRAKNELDMFKLISALTERVAVLESLRQ